MAIQDGDEIVTVMTSEKVAEDASEGELQNVTEITVLPEENAQAILQLLAMSEVSVSPYFKLEQYSISYQ